MERTNVNRQGDFQFLNDDRQQAETASCIPRFSQPGKIERQPMVTLDSILMFPTHKFCVISSFLKILFTFLLFHQPSDNEAKVSQLSQHGDS